MLDGNVLDGWHNRITGYVYAYATRLIHSTCSYQFELTFLYVIPIAIAWLIIPLEVEIRHGWFLFHSWNLFVAICAIPRFSSIFIYLFILIVTTLLTHFLLIFDSLLLGCWLFFFPESPKFLIELGETEEALEVLRYMYQENTGNGQSNYPVKIIITFALSTFEFECRKNKFWDQISSMTFYLQIKSLKERESISTISRRQSKSVRALSMRKPKEMKLLMSEIWQQTKLLCKPPHLRNTVLACAIQFGLTTR